MITLLRTYLGAGFLLAVSTVSAAPQISRLTPPSDLFSYGDPNPPVIARFLPDQRFDLQATIRPDPGLTITQVEFFIDNAPVSGTVALSPATVAGLPAGTAIGTRRAYSHNTPGVHILTVRATQSDNQIAFASGNFEIVNLGRGSNDLAKARHVIVFIGDGMGIAHRTAARIMANGITQGKALAPLSMDRFPVTGIVSTHSLNSIVTDSAPGASCYSTGNKNNNNQEGVFPDDTTDKFDNPRTEYIGEYLARTSGKSLGIVTTSDVFDATPAAWAVHTQDRGAGTGICDQYLDEAAAKANLTVLLGGGRKWFLPSTTPGSARADASDYVLPDDLANGWAVAKGAIDKDRDLLADFQSAGFTYAANATQLNAVGGNTTKLLGLFALSNMNVALDKIAGRRGSSDVTEDYGFPDQPMLDEMTDKALQVLSRNPNGFVLMVEAASIDKQAHNMDSERWILDTIEFDRAIERGRQFALSHPNTLVLITADHECAGVNIIGASTATNAALTTAATVGDGATSLRNPIVGVYEAASFPYYDIAVDGYPVTTDPDRKMLVGYAANADRYEDWLTNAQPLRDSQQPFNGSAPLNAYPSSPMNRDVAGGYLITGQVPGSTAVHTASDIPLSAMGAGAGLFTGVMDNTDVFFKTMQAVLIGAPAAVEPPAVGQRTSVDRLVNTSARGFAGADSQTMILGFVVTGSQSRTLLIRALGSSLAAHGVAGVLADPVVHLKNSTGATVYTNDNWDSDQNLAALMTATTSVGASPLMVGSKEAAMLVTLSPGPYTVLVSGTGGASGVALGEIYELP